MDIVKCEEYSYFQKQISKNKECKNFKNYNNIYLFLKKKFKLFKIIKKIGVKKSFISNIEFMIDRNNNLVKINGGNHRFMISRILKLKKIPIEIKVIHSNNLELIKDKKFKINKINNFINDTADRYA